MDVVVWLRMVGAYLDTASAAVTEMGGHVAKKLGDGLMALFGYPVAQENDAERAARAALSIQRALADINRKNASSSKPALNARIGIETGPVVVDAAGEIYGDAPNTAARVQALAEPGTVVVTAQVQRQIAGLFVAEEHGSHKLKGVPESVTLFRLVRASGGGRRARQRHLTPPATSAVAYASAASAPRAGVGLEPDVTSFYDEATGSVQYVLADPMTRRCAVIDPVLDFDPTSGATRTTSADRLLRHIEANRLTLDWILDTHPHADHFSAAGYLKDVTGAPTAIGERVIEVQRIWKKLYNLPDTFLTDGSQWDRLFADGERFTIGIHVGSWPEAAVRCAAAIRRQLGV